MLAAHPITLPRLRPSVQIPIPEQLTEPPSNGDLVAAARVYYTILRDLSDGDLGFTGDLGLESGQIICSGDPIQELSRQMNARFDRIEETQAVILTRLNHVSRQQNHTFNFASQDRQGRCGRCGAEWTWAKWKGSRESGL
ncbi:hypothetical protein V1525DRAFT_459485 [Lipomyces kononenkoae]|uniref:Uncharacterized protein n=1 Tax=Lipomyces kononenkoae TaxID=34357 RepID=A0ACC3SRY1_LIPKO